MLYIISQIIFKRRALILILQTKRELAEDRNIHDSNSTSIYCVSFLLVLFALFCFALHGYYLVDEGLFSVFQQQSTSPAVPQPPFTLTNHIKHPSTWV